MIFLNRGKFFVEENNYNLFMKLMSEILTAVFDTNSVIICRLNVTFFFVILSVIFSSQIHGHASTKLLH